MAVAMRVNILGADELSKRLAQMDPKTNQAIMTDSLRTIAGLILRNAKDIQITGGGRGKSKALKPLPNRLTSRTGTLRRSIGINLAPLPRAVEVGTDLTYGAVHEKGGRISVPTSTVSAHTRRVVFGRRVAPFKVPSHTRRAHSAKYPPRPFLKPAAAATRPRWPAVVNEKWRKHGGL
jgi:phage gpG-like protein